MKAVLVFCEGRHDVVFAQRSLGAHGGCEWVDRPVGELPSPFGRGRAVAKGLIARRFERQALEDLPLRDAARPPLPCFEAVVENTATGTMFVLVRVHGQDRPQACLELLGELQDTFVDQPSGTFDVSEYAAAFLFDANGAGVAPTVAGFRERYGAHFGDLSDLGHGMWLAETLVPVGCFVFHKSAQEPRGTLEDHLAPMTAEAWPERYAAARRFIDDNRDGDDRVSAREAERLKAIITVTGQFNHPGDPMSIIIGRGSLPQDRFHASPLSAELADFLTRAPWTAS